MYDAIDLSPGDRARLAKLLGRVEPEVVADRILAACVEQIPTYASLSDAGLDQARSRMELVTAQYVNWCTEGRIPGEDDLEILRDSIRADIVAGFSMQDVLASHRLGRLIGWEALGEVCEPEDAPAQLRAADLMLRFADGLDGVIAATYSEQRDDPVAIAERAASRLLGLLGSAELRETQADEALELAADLGFVAASEYRPFMVATPSRRRHHSEVARRLRDSGALAFPECGGIVGLFGAGRIERDPIPSDAVYAIGDTVGEDGIAASLDELGLLIDLAAEAGMVGEISPRAMLLERLLAAAPEVASLLRERIAGTLTRSDASHAGALLPTLRAFVECGMAPGETARRLHVHANTLQYRLRKIEGLDEARPPGVPGRSQRRGPGADGVGGLGAVNEPVLIEGGVEKMRSILSRLDFEAMAERTLEITFEEVPGYAELHESVRRSLAGPTEASFRMLLGALSEGRYPNEGELALLRLGVQAELMLGLSVEDVQRCFRIGGRVGWEAAEEVSTDDEQSFRASNAHIMLTLIEHVVAAVQAASSPEIEIAAEAERTEPEAARRAGRGGRALG